MPQVDDQAAHLISLEDQCDASKPGARRSRSGAAKFGACALGLLLVAAVWLSARTRAPTMHSDIRGVVEKDAEMKNTIGDFPIRYTHDDPGQNPKEKEAVVWTLQFKETYMHSTYAERQEVADNIFGDSVSWVGRAVLQIEVECSLAELEEKLQGHTEKFEYAEQENKNLQAIPDDLVDAERRLEQDHPPSWGIDRSDQRGLPLSDTYSARAADHQGRGSHIYIFDTGIRTSHNDFGGRAISTLEFVDSKRWVCNGDRNCAVDRNGHGTHCAGSAAGTLYGVAKQATLHSVKMIRDDKTGSFDWLNEAIDWVIANKEDQAVISASLSTQSPAHVLSTESAINEAVRSGIVVVVAAGNSNDIACGHTPAYIPSAITVGATRSDDIRSDFSNLGNCLDIFAPGTKIVSASHQADNLPSTQQGTSMACPQVSGAVALLRAGDPRATPQQIAAKLRARSTKDVVHDRGEGSPNELLYVGPDGDDEQPPGASPPAHSDCASTGWKVIQGKCEIDSECCLTSPQYGSNYGSSEGCKIQVGTSPGIIRQVAFETELDFDKLRVPTIDGTRQEFHGPDGPHGIQLEPDAFITWSSDYSVTAKGFKLCLDSRDDCPENGWRKAPKCPETWKYRGKVIHGCTTKNHKRGWCMHDDNTGDPSFGRGDKWADCERCSEP